MTLNEAEQQWNDTCANLAAAQGKADLWAKAVIEHTAHVEKCRLTLRAVFLRLQVVAGGQDE